MIAADLEGLGHPIAGLRLLPGNPRRGDVDAVARSLARFGQRKPIVARRSDSVVVAGNHTLQAAQLLGWERLAVVWVDDDDATAKAFALADNRTSELGGYDDEALAAMVAEVGAVDMELLGAAGYTAADLEALLRRSSFAVPALNDPDEVPEPPDDPVGTLGDLWLLGPHRLLCGDATDATAVEAMLAGERCDAMWTDPPYGVEYVGKTGDALVIQNDSAGGLPALLAGAFAVASAALKPGAAVYVAHAPGPLALDFMQAFVSAGWLWRENLVWVKNVMVLGHADYHYRHEPVLYGFTDGASGRRGRGGDGWFGDNSQTTVFEVPKPSRSESHPTMKPVELIVGMLNNSCPPDGLVYEPFAGSGSTLIAAHQLGVSARAVELDPRYVDVICRRFQEYTGTKPERLLPDGATEPHDFLE